MKVSVTLGVNTIVLDTKWDNDWWENRGRILDEAADAGLRGFIDQDQMDAFLYCCENVLNMDYRDVIGRIIENTSYDLTLGYELWYDSERCTIQPVSPNTIVGNYDFLDNPLHMRYRLRRID